MKHFEKIVEILLIPMLIMSCYTERKTAEVMLPVFDKQGHRGCRGIMPENTIPAMLKAIDLGVTTLEMDAVITADRKVILSHEPFFNHEITTRPDGREVLATEEKELNIYRMSFLETKRYDVGLRPHPRFPKQEKIKAYKPLLSEVIEDVEAYTKLKGANSVFYNIETKTMPATDSIYHPAPEEFVRLLMGVINRQKIERRVIIQSFDYRTLKIIHEQYPSVKTAALVEDFDKKSLDDQIKELGFVPDIYSPHYSLVNEKLVSDCHEKKIRLIPWTVNDKIIIDKLKGMRVDGIITDYPDIFIK